MYTNDQLFKLIMTKQFNFGNNTNFTALKQYIKILLNGAYDLNGTAEELGITKKTLINWNKKLPVKYEIEKVKKNLYSENISKWTLDEIADWNDNFRLVRKKFVDEVLKSDIDSRVTFCIDSDGSKADYYFSHEYKYIKWLEKHNYLDTHSFNVWFPNGKLNPSVFKYFKTWSLNTFGWADAYTKVTYYLDTINFDNNFFNLLEDNTNDYLEKIINTPLDKEQREELIKILDFRRDNGHLMKNLDKINECLSYNNIPYKIEKMTEKRKTFWIVRQD